MSSSASRKRSLTSAHSIGIRLPLNTLSAQSDVPGLAGTSTALGDLTVFVKYALYRDFARGRLLSSGLAVTPPTGPGALAGSPIANSLHAAALQPFLGYIYSLGPNVFIQGFSGVNVPADPGVVTMMYNDMALGYFLYRDESGQNRFLGAIVPTFEVHVSTPLNHRLAVGPKGYTGTPDVVDLTFGTGFVLGERRAVHGNRQPGDRPATVRLRGRGPAQRPLRQVAKFADGNPSACDRSVTISRLGLVLFAAASTLGVESPGGQ